MTPVAKLAAFAVVLAASFGVGAAVGAALPELGPSSEPAPSDHAPMVPPATVPASSVPTSAGTPPTGAPPTSDPGHEGHQP